MTTPDDQYHKRRLALAELSVASAMILWATSFPAVRSLVGEGLSPEGGRMHFMTLQVWRFGLFTLIMLPFVWARGRTLRRRAALAHGLAPANPHRRSFWTISIVLGLITVLAFASQAWGMEYTTAANSALITGLNVVFIPLLAPLFGCRRPARIIYVATLLCFLGMGVLTGLHELSMPNRGDLLTLFCAFSFAVAVILVSIHSHRHDTIFFTVVQNAIAFPIFLLMAVGLSVPLAIEAQHVARVIYIAVACTVLPSLAMIWGMRYISESHAALLSTIEPFAGALLGILILSEPFGWNFALGAGLVMAGILMARPAALAGAKPALPAEAQGAPIPPPVTHAPLTAARSSD